MAHIKEDVIPVHTSAGNFDISTKLRRESDDWIVFVHGWGCSKECFDQAFEQPNLRTYSMCSMDLLGFGKSDKSHDFSYDLADHAEVVTQVAYRLGAQNIYLVGHSMGGGVGLLASQEIRDRLKLFVSIEGNLASSDSRTMRILAGHSYPLFSKVFFPMAKRAIKSSKRIDNRQWSKWLESADPWAAYQSARSATAWSDSGKLLPMFLDLSYKAYIYGENSERAPYILPKLQGVETRKIARSEHFPMVDNPKDFYTTLEELIIGDGK